MNFSISSVLQFEHEFFLCFFENLFFYLKEFFMQHILITFSLSQFLPDPQNLIPQPNSFFSLSKIKKGKRTKIKIKI